MLLETLIHKNEIPVSFIIPPYTHSQQPAAKSHAEQENPLAHPYVS